MREAAEFLCHHIVVPIRDFVYPPVCVVCGSMIAGAERHCCSRCWSTFVRILPSDPAWVETEGKVRDGDVVGGFLSCYLFEHGCALQDVVHLLKYGHATSIGIRLGRDIGAVMMNGGTVPEPGILVPVPLHRVKERERGYNQSTYLSRGIAAICSLPVRENVLRRIRHTVSQTTLSRTERLANVGGAFAVPRSCRESVAGMTVYLVDDVITTGATVRACAAALNDAGVRRVVAVSAAIAL
jgi:ComF family protein